MKDIVLYTNIKGKSQVYEYLNAFNMKKDKSSRINREKVHDYINALKIGGISIGYPYIKYIGDKIWELRPLDNRILFFETNDCYVLLNTFKKQTVKTPINEIRKARLFMNDYLERNK